MNHTPTPWKVEKLNQNKIFSKNSKWLIAQTYNLFEYNDILMDGDSNAAYIVHCVNMHEELVEALEKIASETYEGPHPMEIARAVLAKEKEK